MPSCGKLRMYRFESKEAQFFDLLRDNVSTVHGYIIKLEILLQGIKRCALQSLFHYTPCTVFPVTTLSYL
jgi:hypothetical protein